MDSTRPRSLSSSHEHLAKLATMESSYLVAKLYEAEFLNLETKLTKYQTCMEFKITCTYQVIGFSLVIRQLIF